MGLAFLTVTLSWGKKKGSLSEMVAWPDKLKHSGSSTDLSFLIHQSQRGWSILLSSPNPLAFVQKQISKYAAETIHSESKHIPSLSFHIAAITEEKSFIMRLNYLFTQDLPSSEPWALTVLIWPTTLTRFPGDIVLHCIIPGTKLNIQRQNRFYAKFCIYKCFAAICFHARVCFPITTMVLLFMQS